MKKKIKVKKKVVKDATPVPLSTQMKTRKIEKDEVYSGNTEVVISTGSTLLDLAISGERTIKGGLPTGIMVEVFGGEASGKTVLLCEIAGGIQRAGGDILFNDPEARLNKKFAELFDLNTSELTVNEPNTVTEVFQEIYNWTPKTKAKVHGIITDSLAALSTNLEMDNEDGDKMGMRRAKEFSEGFRKTCRVLKQSNYLMVCSNQIRDNSAPMGHEQFSVPGGKAIAFYASVRLRFHKPEKINKDVTVAGKKLKKVIGVKTKVEVYKNSVDSPYRTADLYIIFDYGIDDIRANLQYIKDYKGYKTYSINGNSLSNELEKAIRMVEKGKLESELKNEVIQLWKQIQEKFKAESRKKKQR